MKAFTVFRPVAGQNFPTFLFVVRARSLAAAKALVASKVAGETLVFQVRNRRGPIAAHLAAGAPGTPVFTA